MKNSSLICFGFWGLLEGQKENILIGQKKVYDQQDFLDFFA